MVATFNKTVRKHIFLHPADSRRKFAALKSALLKDRRKYCHKLEGALLDVNKLKVIGSRHLVVEGYTSMEVEADCCVFAPRPGHKLEGVINKQSYSHLGCLVMGIFNASLNIPSRQDLVPQIGDVVSFVVNEVVVDGEIMFLRGSLEGILKRATLVNPENTDDPVSSPDKEVKPNITTIKTNPSDSDSSSPTQSKKKKKKSNNDVIVKQEPQTLSQSSEDENLSKSSKHKKKKKKREHEKDAIV